MNKFFLKITAGIIVVFGLLFVGMALYEPLWFRIKRGRIESKDEAIRLAAAKAVAAKGVRAMPHIKKWLDSGNDARVAGACLVLEKMEDNTWEKALHELETILKDDHSKRTDCVVALLKKKGCIDFKFVKKHVHEFPDFSKLKEYSKNCHVKYIPEHSAVMRNTCIYILSHDKNGDMRAIAAINLGEIGDPQALNLLVEAMENDTDGNVRIYSIRALANFYSFIAVKMIELFAKEDEIFTCLNYDLPHSSKYGGSTIYRGYCIKDDGSMIYRRRYIDETAKAIAETLRKIMPPYFPLGDCRGLISESIRHYRDNNRKKRASKRKKRTEIMLDWFNKNRHRLAWDPVDCRYYIK
jgi:hypothetical protein